MNKIDERLFQIKTENIIWIICLILIGLSIYANSFEAKYFTENDYQAKEKYRSLLIFIFTIAFIIYLYYFYDSLTSYQEALLEHNYQTTKLAFYNLLASILIAVAGAILLYIALIDDDLNTEISFT